MVCNNRFCAHCKNKKCQLEFAHFNEYGICEDMIIEDEKHKKLVDEFKTLIES